MIRNNHCGKTPVEKDLNFPLPKQLVGKIIKQLEVVPIYRNIEAIFIFEDDEIKKAVLPSFNVMAIALGLV